MFGGDEWLIIAIVALVLFGGSQLPKLARSLGEAQRELKKGMRDDDEDETPTKQPEAKQPEAKQLGTEPPDTGTPTVTEPTTTGTDAS